ncbi:enoyl-CoA hydratase-related protein [Rhizorhabdus dicambivorans]|uniref:enoyl-CoA hydratase-related protein n=1 Tax=Rhizorhabdus dicambivorans TaxID=1850238 RepID=UPI000833A071|nr:enoyl-CoA hydratase-related protein [Rhizorhabdus dicambivorans]
MTAVLYERSGRIVTLTLNRPEMRNALSGDVVEALVAGARKADADSSVSCVVIVGAGESFCSGGNLHELRDLTVGQELTQSQLEAWYREGIQQIPRAFYDLDVVTIAAVHGHAIGAGCDLAAMCDIRVAAPDASFAESFVRVGLVSGDGGAWFLPRVIGHARAKEMMLTAEPVAARKALDWGLVNVLAEEGRLMETAMQVAERIAALPPNALRGTKQLLRRMDEASFGRGLDEATAMQAALHQQPDHLEAVAAVLEKRRGNFTGALGRQSASSGDPSEDQ